MKTTTILILTFLLSPWTVHANGEAEETPAIEPLKNIQTETRGPQAFEQTAVQPDTTNKQQLLERVRERGTVRVGVIFGINHSPERELSAGQRHAQRAQIELMHKEFINELNKNELNAKIGSQLITYPRIFLTVDEEAFLHLFEMPMIKKVEPVRYGTTF